MYFEKQKFEEVIIEGPQGQKLNALFTSLRVSRMKNVPQDIIVLSVRHSDESGEMATIERKVVVNHAGDLIVTKQTLGVLEANSCEDDKLCVLIHDGADWEMYFDGGSLTYDEYKREVD